MDFNHSSASKDMAKRVSKFVHEHILPLETSLLNESQHGNPDWQQWSVDPRIETLKEKAKAEGLWNLFLPGISGLTNADYAPIADLTGMSLIAPEVFN